MLFNNKTILVTGGTGSIGSEIVRRLLASNAKQIKIFSRDEYKQHRLKHEFSNYSHIKFILGDVRDKDSLDSACKNVDIIFHAAALKHVPVSEEIPEEFIKTNVLGSINLKKVAIQHNIESVISISSDKAVHPSNVMGFTKALQEKIFTSNSLSGENQSTRFVNVRFGNVIGTNGSLFPIVYHKILHKEDIPLTHSDMTRFFMSKKEAVDLIFWAYEHGNNGETIIKKMKSIYIEKLLNRFIQITKSRVGLKNIGLRLGEKLYESLITDDELFRTIQKGDYFILKPITTDHIENNTAGNLSENLHIDSFHSYSKSNFVEKQELDEYIKDYIYFVKKQYSLI
jgi:UDP-N-acetylglucosamine 4,6-dehydratase/5-epimerase